MERLKTTFAKMAQNDLKHILRPTLFFSKKCGLGLNPPPLVENFHIIYFFFIEGFPKLIFNHLLDVSYDLLFISGISSSVNQ